VLATASEKTGTSHEVPVFLCLDERRHRGWYPVLA